MSKSSETAIYQKIAQQVVEALPDSWREAWVDFVFDRGVVTANGQYVAEANGQTLDFVVHRSINHLIHELCGLATQASGDTWKTAKFTLRPDGAFKLDIQYADK